MQLAGGSGLVCPVRHLNLHEYQSKKLMESYKINTQKFEIAETPEEAGRAAKSLGKCEKLVVKYQASFYKFGYLSFYAIDMNLLCDG